LNWDAIGAVGEIIGAIAVVITLLYLATQTRINTKAVKTSTFFAANDTLAQWQLRVAESPVYFPIVLMVHRGETDFSEEEWIRLDYAYRALFNSFEAMHIQYTQGFVDEQIWKKRMGTCKWMVTSWPALERWWEQEKELGIQDNRFVDAVDSAQAMQDMNYSDIKRAT
jgi:hypothetical protein